LKKAVTLKWQPFNIIFNMKLIFFPFIFILSISLHNCSLYKSEQKIAIIDGNDIFQNQIDSLTSMSVYEIKKDALKSLIKQKVVELEAKKRNLAIQDLIKIEINNKIDKIEEYEYRDYIERYNLKDVDTSEIISYLTAIKIRERHEIFSDSLIQISDVKIFLKPFLFKNVEINNVQYFDLTPENNIVVYFITDYDCPACMDIKTKLESIIEKYKNKVNFRFVYLSDFISSKALAIYSANKQNKFNEMHQAIISKNQNLSKEYIYNLAKELGLNMPIFKNDYNNPNTLKKFLKTKENLISKGIYSTPTIIVNSKVLDDELAIYTLEEVIENELH
jgi:thiol-disulfide isomerase/thioredoxin